MAEMETLLELSTAIKRRHIKIDGEPYEIINTDELTWPEQIEILSIKDKIERIYKLDAADADILVKTLNRVFEKILLAPKEIQDKLFDGQKADIINAVFNQGVGLKSPKVYELSPPSKDSSEEKQ